MCVIFKHIFIFCTQSICFSYNYFLIKKKIFNEKQSHLFINEIEMRFLLRNKQTSMIKLKWFIDYVWAKKKISIKSLDYSWNSERLIFSFQTWMRSIFQSQFFLSFNFALDLNAELPNMGVRRTFLFYFIQLTIYINIIAPNVLTNSFFPFFNKRTLCLFTEG